jgi:cytochrome c biogenesis protein
MEAGKPVSGAPPAAGWSGTISLVSPLRAVWWLVTSVRFAILLLALLCVVSLAGVLIPQMPANVRGDVMLEADWLDSQEGRFGAATVPLDSLGFFDVFHQRWFALLMALTVVSTSAYIISRLPGVWHTITRPRKRVPDRYFDLAPHRVQGDGRVDPGALAGDLRRKRYRVEEIREDDTVYLFADRFQWAQLGTFLTHASVIVFILSAVVSRVDAFSSPLFLAEGGTLPIFAVKDPEQMQVHLLNAHAEFAEDGRPLDYRTDMVIYRRGEEVLRCSSTVNSPCEYDGYRFYQAAYFGYGAELSVREASTGNLLYRETLPLPERVSSPRVLVTREQGVVLLDEAVVLPEVVETAEGAYRAGLVRLADGRPLTLWLPVDGDGKLLAFEPGALPDGIRAELAEGESASMGGATITYTRSEDTPTAVIRGVPLPDRAGGGRGDVQLALGGVVYGTSRTSGGDVPSAAPPSPDGPRLTVTGIGPQPLVLGEEETREIDGLVYSFEGHREFAGIDVRRDRSDTLVWIGAAAAVIGLMVTFWVPRRRLWAKIDGSRLALAGQAPGHADYTRELRDIAAAAGTRIKDGNLDDD